MIEEMARVLDAKGIPMGIYTTKTYWNIIMGNNMNFGKYSLWYPRYDGVNSFEFFAPFAGWTTLSIKQTAGDAPWCGISQVDSDFIEEK